MKKQELVMRELADGYFEGIKSFTQLGLSKTLGVSLNTVNRAIKNLSAITAVRVNRRSLEISEFDRLMMYWATHRGLRKDIVYATRADMSIRDIETDMPQGIAFTGYTAYKRLFDDSPSDYSEVYLYATPAALEEIKERFGSRNGPPNLIVLAADYKLVDEIEHHRIVRSSVSAPQAYVDLWNLDTWYAKEFVDALAKRLGI